MEATKARPAWLRALGQNEPPELVTTGGREWKLERVIKHDSWAATAVYGRAKCGGPADGGNRPARIVVKFNRVQRLGLIPMGWLGRWLAAREAAMFGRLQGIAGIVAAGRMVTAGGRRLPNAVAHDWIEGHPLRWHDRPGAEFFEALHRMVLAIHARGVACVDLNKWENIIIDRAGRPHLIDFQISLALPRIWPLSAVLRVFQQCDLYHLSKHASRVCPGQFGPDCFGVQPWWIRLHRRIAEPFRRFRRSLLVRLGVRRGGGKPQSEQFIEEGLRGTADGMAPVQQLYRLLASARYEACLSSRGTPPFATMFVDLIGRPPQNRLEAEFVASHEQRTRHDQIVWLLKSELFLAHTSGWDPQQVEGILGRLNRNLAARESRAA